jgi:hypothetical protein
MRVKMRLLQSETRTSGFTHLAVPALCVLLFAGLGVWMWSQAETTVNKRKLMVPRVQITLAESASLPENLTTDPTAAAAAQDRKAQQQDNQPQTPPQTTPQAPARQGLEPAPYNTLSDTGPFGLIPRVGSDGTEPWRAYARPATDYEGKARLAVMITGLGLKDHISDMVLQLPANITLGFNPYGSKTASQMEEVRANGFETALEVPMEPLKSSVNDMGPYSLQLDLSARNNLERLKWILARGQGYVGLVNLEGDKFVRYEQALKPVLKEISDRGLLFIDNAQFTTNETQGLGKDLNLKILRANFKLDQNLVEKRIRESFTRAEKQLQTGENLIVHMQATPLGLSLLSQWLRTLPEKEIQLVPVSQLARDLYTLPQS